MAIATSTRFQRSDGIDGDQVLVYLENHPEVQELRCEEVVNDEHVEAMDRLLVNYHSAIHLTALELPQNGLTASVGSSIANILRVQRETLIKLDLSHNPLTSAGFNKILDPLTMESPTSRLQILNLTETQLGSKGVNLIATLLRHNETIEELYLGHNNFGTKGIKTIAPEVANNATLRLLDLSYNNIRSRGATILAQMLENSTASTLRILDVTCNKLGAPGIQAFARYLVMDRKLEGFFAGGNNIGSDGAAYLGNVLKHNYVLKEVRLEDNQIGDAGTWMLAEGLSGSEFCNSAVERLHLGWNGIGLEGATSLADALKENSRLAYLDLTGNRICCFGAEALADSLSYNQALKELNVTHNHVSDDGAQAFAREMGKASCKLLKLAWQDNPMSDEGHSALHRCLELRRNQQYWLGQLLRDLAKGTISSIQLLDQAMGDDELLALTNVLVEKRPLVRSLWLPGKNLSPRGLVPFAEKAMSTSNIVRLYLRGCEHGDDLAQALSVALTANTKLEVLSLMGCSVSAHGAAALANGLCRNKTLRRLHLDRNLLGDAGMFNFGRALPHPSLVSLSVSYNLLTDQTLRMASLSTLQELHMNGNKITDRGALELCGSLPEDSPLSWISLRENHVTQRGAQTLKTFLPNVTVEY